MVSDGLTDDQWADAVLAVLEGPMHDIGMGEPNVAPCYVMWHCSAATPGRPLAGSPVWMNSGGACYDITVREDEHGDGGRVLLVWTEGSNVLSCPAPSTAGALAAALRPFAEGLGAGLQRDFQHFETHDGGYLPGAEPWTA